MLSMIIAGALAASTAQVSLTERRYEPPLDKAATEATSIFKGNVISSTAGPSPYRIEVEFDENKAGPPLARAHEHVTLTSRSPALPGARYVFFLQLTKERQDNWTPLKLRLLASAEPGIKDRVIIDFDNFRFIPEDMPVHEITFSREINDMDGPPRLTHEKPIVLNSYIDMKELEDLIQRARRDRK